MGIPHQKDTAKTRQHILPYCEGHNSLGMYVRQKKPCCYGCNNTLSVAMECPGMMACAMAVGGKASEGAHHGARKTLKEWGVHMMRRPVVKKKKARKKRG